MTIEDTRKKRLGLLFSESGLLQRDFADKCDTSESYLSLRLNGKKPLGSKKAREIERLIGKPVGWLDLPILFDEPAADSLASSFPSSGNSAVSLIPVVSWEAIAKKKREKIGMTVFAGSIGANAFALVVENDAMAGEFVTGDTIVIDPELKPKTNDYVVVAKKRGGAYILRQYIKDGDDILLVAASSNYPTERLTTTPVFAGVVVAKVKNYSR